MNCEQEAAKFVELDKKSGIHTFQAASIATTIASAGFQLMVGDVVFGARLAFSCTVYAKQGIN
jgi:hypothetical protein